MNRPISRPQESQVRGKWEKVERVTSSKDEKNHLNACTTLKGIIEACSDQHKDFRVRNTVAHLFAVEKKACVNNFGKYNNFLTIMETNIQIYEFWLFMSERAINILRHMRKRWSKLSMLLWELF